MKWFASVWDRLGGPALAYSKGLVCFQPRVSHASLTRRPCMVSHNAPERRRRRLPLPKVIPQSQRPARRGLSPPRVTTRFVGKAHPFRWFPICLLFSCQGANCDALFSTRDPAFHRQECRPKHGPHSRQRKPPLHPPGLSPRLRWRPPLDKHYSKAM